jgi:NADPH:quinone reductase-like Zn-dependent oxidoreductase
MKALILRRHGGLDDLDVVADYPTPKPGDGEVVIRVRAAAFNYHDVFTMRGMPGIKVPLPVVIGLDMAGEIAEVGAGVADWKAGDRVLVNPVNKTKGLMGEMLDGGMAEYCRVAADQLVAMPAGVSFEQAAALPVAYGTAHRMLITHRTVKAGDKVLVLGASGGVGTGCVLLAKMLGAEVIACASSDEKLARLKRSAPTMASITPRPTGRSGRSKPTASRSGGLTTAASTWWSISPAATPGCRRCAVSSAAASFWSAAPPPATTPRRICATSGALNCRSSAPTVFTTTISRP